MKEKIKEKISNLRKEIHLLYLKQLKKYARGKNRKGDKIEAEIMRLTLELRKLRD